MFLNYICQQLQPNEHKIIYIPFAMLKPGDMLKMYLHKIKYRTSGLNYQNAGENSGLHCGNTTGKPDTYP